MQADALHGGILVSLGILGQHLAGMQHAVRIAPDDIGKRAAPVDPEIPASDAHPALLLIDCHICKHAQLIDYSVIDNMSIK